MLRHHREMRGVHNFQMRTVERPRFSVCEQGLEPPSTLQSARSSGAGAGFSGLRWSEEQHHCWDSREEMSIRSHHALSDFRIHKVQEFTGKHGETLKGGSAVGPSLYTRDDVDGYRGKAGWRFRPSTAVPRVMNSMARPRALVPTARSSRLEGDAHDLRRTSGRAECRHCTRYARSRACSPCGRGVNSHATRSQRTSARRRQALRAIDIRVPQ